MDRGPRSSWKKVLDEAERLLVLLTLTLESCCSKAQKEGVRRSPQAQRPCTWDALQGEALGSPRRQLPLTLFLLEHFSSNNDSERTLGTQIWLVASRRTTDKIQVFQQELEFWKTCVCYCGSDSLSPQDFSEELRGDANKCAVGAAGARASTSQVCVAQGPRF